MMIAKVQKAVAIAKSAGKEAGLLNYQISQALFAALANHYAGFDWDFMEPILSWGLVGLMRADRSKNQPVERHFFVADLNSDGKLDTGLEDWSAGELRNRPYYKDRGFTEEQAVAELFFGFALGPSEGWIAGHWWEQWSPNAENNPVDVEVGDRAVEIGARWADVIPWGVRDLDQLPNMLREEMCLSQSDRLQLVMGR